MKLNFYSTWSMIALFFASISLVNAQTSSIKTLHPRISSAPMDRVGVQSPKYAYAYLELDVVLENMGIIKFPLKDPSKFELISSNPEDLLGVGAYANDLYYVFNIVTTQSGQELAHSLGTIDLQTGDTNRICTYNPNNVMKMIDLTYDYSTSKMYGLQWGKNAASTLETVLLVTIDLNSGVIQEIAPFRMQMRAVAATKNGNLFGVGADGGLYRINKSNAELTYIGNTGIIPVSYHSMDFDHDTEELYWSGVYFGGDQRPIFFLNTVDTLTGKILTNFVYPNRTQISGIFVSFNQSAQGAPNMVEDLGAKVVSEDFKEVKLTWENPSNGSRNEEVVSLNGVKIYRDKVLIHTFNTSDLGAKCTYVDAHTTDGMRTYKLVPYNEKGDGLSSIIRCFVGKDVPGQVDNIIFQNNRGKASLSWDKPLSGRNNGWCDTNNLSYEIIRYPEMKNLGWVSTNSYIDKDISYLANYWYKITPKNDQGVGVENYSEKIAVGPPMTPPLHYDFYNNEIFNKFTVLDHDKDTYMWTKKTSAFDTISYAQYFNFASIADDYLFLPPMDLKSGTYYKFSFIFSGYGPTNITNVRVVKGLQPNADVKILADYPKVTTQYTEILHKNIIFTPEKDETYYLGWQVYGDHGYRTTINSMSLDIIPTKEFAALKLIGNTMPSANDETVFTVEIENLGALTQKDFSLKLIDANRNILAETIIQDSIHPEMKKKFQISWTPKIVENINMRCVVSLNGDLKPQNDTSSRLIIKVQAPNELTTVKIGEDEDIAFNMPFVFNKKYGYTQTIYNKEDLAKAGKIQKISFFNNFSQSVTKRVQVYLLNTLETDLEKQFIDKSLFTLVLDKEITFPEGANTVTIDLDKAFVYNGDNICVAAENMWNVNVNTTKEVFYGSKSQIANQARYIYDDTVGGLGYTASIVPNVVFMMETKNGASIKGDITDKNGPLAGVKVGIQNSELEKYTNSLGQYAIEYVAPGTYSVCATLFGYIDYIAENITLAKSQKENLNIKMQTRPCYRVNGKVKNLLGDPIVGAIIKVNGYDTASTISKADGTFELTALYGSANYTLFVNHPSHKSQEVKVEVKDANLQLDEIKMEEFPFPPFSINAKAKDSAMLLTWKNFNKPVFSHWEYDDGSFENGTRHNPKTASMLGNLYPNTDSGVITHVIVAGIHFVENNTPVEIYIYDKNRQLISKGNSVVIPSNDWVEVAVGNVKFVGDYYVMLCWQHTREETNWLPIDEDGPSHESGLGFEYSMSMNQWRTMTQGGLHPGVFGIRTKVVLETSDQLSSLPTFEKSKIYRLNDLQQKNEKDWTLIGEANEGILEVSDSVFYKLTQGVYRYAVKNEYKGVENISSSGFSQSIQVNMHTKATINVVCNTTPEDIEGAKVIIQNTDDYTLALVAYVEKGKVTFDSLVKGRYSINISKDGFKSIEKFVEMPTENIYEFGPYSLSEIIIAPQSLMIETTEKTNEKLFLWNTNKMIFENFETHEDFAINSPGRIGWKYIDGDDSKTQAFINTAFPGMEEKMAYMIMNPSKTTPSLRELTTDAVPYSGNKFLAGIAAVNGPNADYIISPKLYYTNQFYFVVAAKAFGIGYGAENIEIGVSKTTDKLSDFTFKKVDLYTVWDIISYIMPKEVKYICIKYSSDRKMMAMVDDIYIGAQDPLAGASTMNIELIQNEKMPKAIMKYEVYLDGILVGETDKDEFIFKNLTNGSHIAGVKAIFTSGASKLSVIDFTVTVDNDRLMEVDQSKVRIHPNPSTDFINIEGEYSSLTITDLRGTVLFNSDVKIATLSTRNFVPGVYLLKTLDAKGSNVIKFVVSR